MRAGEAQFRWREQARIVKESLESAKLDFMPKINRRSSVIAGKRPRSVSASAGAVGPPGGEPAEPKFLRALNDSAVTSSDAPISTVLPGSKDMLAVDGRSLSYSMPATYVIAAKEDGFQIVAG